MTSPHFVTAIGHLAELKQVANEGLGDRISAAAKDGIVELVALKCHSVAEEFLAEHFYLCLSEDPSIPGVQAKMSARSRAEAELLLLQSGAGRKDFISWLPYDSMLGLANTYLAAGHPFDRLRNRAERKTLKELVIVRNAVAHPSESAGAKLRGLAASKQYQISRPADYLRSTRAGSLEIDVILATVESVVRALASPTEFDALPFMTSENPYDEGAFGPVGFYECNRCGSGIELAVAAKLTKCPHCPRPTGCQSCGQRRNVPTQWRRTPPDTELTGAPLGQADGSPDECRVRT